MNPTIILQGITIEEFRLFLEQIIDTKIREALADLQKPSDVRYLNSTEVCALLKISKPTLHDWRKLGLIKAYRLSRKVYFKSNEIEEAIENKISKHRRNFKRP